MKGWVVGVLHDPDNKPLYLAGFNLDGYTKFVEKASNALIFLNKQSAEMLKGDLSALSPQYEWFISSMEWIALAGDGNE